MSGKYCSPLSSLPVAAQRAIEEAALAYNRGFESYKWRNLDEVFDEYCTKNPLATTAEKEALLVELLQVELKKPIPFGKPNGPGCERAVTSDFWGLAVGGVYTSHPKIV